MRQVPYWPIVLLPLVVLWAVALAALRYAGEPTPVVGVGIATPPALVAVWLLRPQRPE